MERLPVVLLHGYGARARSLLRWRDELIARGYDATAIHLGEFISLSNEITIKDIAEGFDRALRLRAGLGAEEPFDAIVHSTGGLVIREWLATYGSRRRRLKRLVALAPATFGSPLAHKGRSWLGAMFRGERELGPDFMEAGERVLSGLELGSAYTWDLAHRDLLAREAIYDESPDSPFPFVIIGLGDYGIVRRLFAGQPGTDGTVRWAAAGFNIRKLEVDLTREPGAERGHGVSVAPWHNVHIPLVLYPGVNHAEILSEPPRPLVDMVIEALAVKDLTAYRAWRERHSTTAGGRLSRVEEDAWQQFVVHAVDERGDSIVDYYLELGSDIDGEFRILENFALDVHPYTDDPSFRCFHVNLTRLDPARRGQLRLRLTALTGTELVAYHGQGSETFTAQGIERRDPGKWDAQIDITPILGEPQISFFFPFTTTLIEIKLNREPMPPAPLANRLLTFVDQEPVERTDSQP